MKEKIKELAGAGQKFLIACRSSADEIELLAGQTLKKILEGQNKEVFLKNSGRYCRRPAIRPAFFKK
jgi:hypothetical protein